MADTMPIEIRPNEIQRWNQVWDSLVINASGKTGASDQKQYFIHVRRTYLADNFAMGPRNFLELFKQNCALLRYINVSVPQMMTNEEIFMSFKHAMNPKWMEEAEMFNFTEQSVLLNFLEGKHRESKETKRKTSNTNNNNSGGSNRQNKRHQTNDPRSGRGAGSTRRINGDCHNCGKPGHRAVDCRAPSGGAHRQGNQNQGSYALQHGGGNGRNGSNNGNNYGGGNYR